jgi:Na+/H+ antiporter NhaD/arsenite permease-like protein
VFAFGRLPKTRVDRPAMAVIGAALMFMFRVLSPANGITSIDYATIVLLFAMMLIVAGLHLGGFFDAISHNITERLDRRHLLPGVIFTAGILSAFLVNDVVCLFMAPLVLKIVKRWDLPALPYLLALATASNIGSTATITGNPQNILIGSVSRIGYLDFMFHLGPVALIGLFVDWGLLHWFFRNSFVTAGNAAEDAIASTTTHTQPFNLYPVLVTCAVLIAFLAGVEPPLAAGVGASLLLLYPQHAPKEMFAEVDWSLLVFFVGLFLILGGVEQSGISRGLFAAASTLNLHVPAIYTLFTVVLSNVVSNVPAVMLLKGTTSNFNDPHAGWLLLAMASTLAGNLTITGSVANIIVVEKAAPEVHVSFLDYAKVGVPITIATVAIGWAWLTFVHY